MNDLNSRIAPVILDLADDELILAHRNSEWCGHAPILEEDIAFANLALDELGHAVLWYRLYSELTGQDPETTPDRLVYFREPFEFRAAQFCALPNGDWAFSMLRQYLWDALEASRLSAFSRSGHPGLAATAAKILTEEVYHLRHTRAWVRRLGLGTEESARRMQTALEELWPYAPQLLDAYPDDELAQALGMPPGKELRAGWDSDVRQFLADSGLNVPDLAPRTLDRSLQSVHLVAILADLQQVARLDPGAEW